MSDICGNGARAKKLGASAGIVKGLFESASSHKAYRKALYFAKRLKATDQLLILDDLFAAADRLHVDRVTGVPKVKPRGEIKVRGRNVIVEELS